MPRTFLPSIERVDGGGGGGGGVCVCGGGGDFQSAFSISRSHRRVQVAWIRVCAVQMTSVGTDSLDLTNSDERSVLGSSWMPIQQKG